MKVHTQGRAKNKKKKAIFFKILPWVYVTSQCHICTYIGISMFFLDGGIKIDITSTVTISPEDIYLSVGYLENSQ